MLWWSGENDFLCVVEKKLSAALRLQTVSRNANYNMKNDLNELTFRNLTLQLSKVNTFYNLPNVYQKSTW